MADALCGGTEAMRIAGELYLPNLGIEKSKDYEARLKQTVLLNMFSRAIGAAVGKVFKKPIVLQEEKSDDIQEWSKNINKEGKSLGAFAQELFRNAVKDGVSHFIVDMSQSTAETREEQKQKNERPYWIQFPAKQIIGWRFEIQSDIQVLTQLRRLYTAKVSDSLWGTKNVERVTVYEPGIYHVYEKDDKGDWFLTDDEGSTGVDYIPLVSLYTDQTGYMQARPAFLDLAYKNVEHWQSSSDQRHILKWARFAIPVVSGWDASEDKMSFGPSSLVKLTDPQAKMYFAEHKGAAIDAGFKDLEQLKEEMAYLALDPFLRSRPGNMPATTRVLDEVGANSQLSGWAKNLKAALEQGLQYTAERANTDFKGNVALNEDFSSVEMSDSKSVVEAFRAGLIPRKIGIAEMQRLGSYSDYTIEEIEEIFDEESRKSGVLERIGI
ncbi:MAG: DUF4055 domain-containing protein [Proteobacteria bacterium]|nr:DUF4055 domain-containing protein [Pseudomonadota bacterium]